MSLEYGITGIGMQAMKPVGIRTADTNPFDLDDNLVVLWSWPRYIPELDFARCCHNRLKHWSIPPLISILIHLHRTTVSGAILERPLPLYPKSAGKCPERVSVGQLLNN